MPITLHVVRSVVSGAAVSLRAFAVTLGSALARSLRTYRIERALTDLPDAYLADVGLMRSDIGFAAAAIASGEHDPTRDPLHQLNRSIVKQDMSREMRSRPAMLNGLVCAGEAKAA